MQLLTAEEAAELIRHTTKTLANWRCRGEGPAFYYIGRRVFYRKAELVEWVNSRRATNSAQHEEIQQGAA